MIVLTERHLKRLMPSYLLYYRQDRTHLGLAKDTLAGRRTEIRSAREWKIQSFPRLGGLHHLRAKFFFETRAGTSHRQRELETPRRGTFRVERYDLFFPASRRIHSHHVKFDVALDNHKSLQEISLGCRVPEDVRAVDSRASSGPSLPPRTWIRVPT